MPKKMSGGDRLTLKLGLAHKRMLESVIKLEGADSAVAWLRAKIEEAYRPHSWNYFIRSLTEGKRPVLTTRQAGEIKLERWDPDEVTVSVPSRRRKPYEQKMTDLRRKAVSLLGVNKLTLWVRDAGPQAQPAPDSLVSLNERLAAIERQLAEKKR